MSQPLPEHQPRVPASDPREGEQTSHASMEPVELPSPSPSVAEDFSASDLGLDTSTSEGVPLPTAGAERTNLDNVAASEPPSDSEPRSLRRSARLQAKNQSQPVPKPQPVLRRSARLMAKKALGLLTLVLTGLIQPPVHSYVMFKDSLEDKLETITQKAIYYQEAVQLNADGSSNFLHPLSFATQTAGNEVYHFHQAMQQDDRDAFIQAMIKELQDHHDNKHWTLVKRSSIGNSPTIKAIWSFKRKR